MAKNMRHLVKPWVTTRRSAPISASGFPSPTPTEIKPHLFDGGVRKQAFEVALTDQENDGNDHGQEAEDEHAGAQRRSTCGRCSECVHAKDAEHRAVQLGTGQHRADR